jgi:hypothetical protein
MPRPNAAAKSVTDAVQSLLDAVTGLVQSVQGTLAQGQQVGKAAQAVGRTATAKSERLKSALKSYWSQLKGKAREERIRKMLAGRGLTPKGAGKAPSAKGRRGGKRRSRRRRTSGSK